METDTLVFPTGSLILMRFNIDATGSRNRELLNGSKKRDGFIQRTKDPISHLTGATTIFGPLLVLSQRTIRPANEKEWPMRQAILCTYLPIHFFILYPNSCLNQIPRKKQHGCFLMTTPYFGMVSKPLILCFGKRKAYVPVLKSAIALLRAIFLEADREYAIQPADLYCGIRS